MGVAAGDYDNDGYTDLYVTNYEHNILYHNNGNGTFTDVTATAGVASSGWSTSAAFIDYDRDGLLDLAVVHYVQFFRRPCYSPQGSKDYCGPQPFKAIRHATLSQPRERALQRRDGGGGPERQKGTRTGYPDRRFRHGRLSGFHGGQRWRGQPSLDQLAPRGAVEDRIDRVFHEEGLTHGLAYASDGKARAGMGIADGDIYGDGGEAVVVTNLPNEAFTLFQRQPNGDFVDATEHPGCPTFPCRTPASASACSIWRIADFSTCSAPTEESGHDDAAAGRAVSIPRAQIAAAQSGVKEKDSRTSRLPPARPFDQWRSAGPRFSAM